MIFQETFAEFSASFKQNDTIPSRRIGLECEIPIVTRQGEAVSFQLMQQLFAYLEKEGFSLKRDNFSKQVIAATIENPLNIDTKSYVDTITTDAGYCILEIALAPYGNLHAAHQRLSELLALLKAWLSLHDCLMLGYGVQPVTRPSSKLMAPYERYYFYLKHFNKHLPTELERIASHVHKISASNQCHIDIGEKEAILAVNVLNALSGLQIALQANSPIWLGERGENKSNRELFWDTCFSNSLYQIGLPPSQFKSLKAYFDYLLEFKPRLIKRNGQLVQILGKETFKDFLGTKEAVKVRNIAGEFFSIYPEAKDIHYHNSYCFFNARLVPQYGTIESRMSCQQPPNETMVSAALTLGILENLEEAASLMNSYSWKSWQKLRKDAAKDAFGAKLNDGTIIPLLQRLLAIVDKGLRKRMLGEELFLAPLFQRLEQQESPADKAVSIFERQGKQAFIDFYAF